MHGKPPMWSHYNKNKKKHKKPSGWSCTAFLGAQVGIRPLVQTTPGRQHTDFVQTYQTVLPDSGIVEENKKAKKIWEIAEEENVVLQKTYESVWNQGAIVM